MKKYTRCPQRNVPAREVWKHFVRKNTEDPRAIWKMPQNFRKEPTMDGGWGMWIADYGTHYDYYDPTKPDTIKVTNLFAFLKVQTVLEQNNE